MGNETVEAVRRAGVVGAGGAGFPTYVKLGSQVQDVIVNGAECEPLLRTDPYLLRSHPEQVLRGLEIAMQATGAQRGYVAVKAKHAETVAGLEQAVRGEKGVTVFPLDDFYPAGDEHVLVREVLGRTVPEGGLPTQAGVLVQNVQTLINVAAAVDLDAPVLDKWVTVNGWVRRPTTVRVAVGTPVVEMLSLAGGPRGEDFAVIEGGPMTGRVVADLQQPVTRVTGGLIVLPREHKVISLKTRPVELELRLAASVCCGCQECTFMCPRNLLGHHLHPHKITKQLPLAVPNSGTYLEAFLCSQCSVCDLYACPMGLSPKRLFAHVRAELVRAGAKNPNQGRAAQPHPYVTARHLPIPRLIARLGLKEYDVPAKLEEEPYRPRRVTIPLLMGAGAPAEPVVAVGERVKRGQVVGAHRPDRLGVSVHASIGGVVEAVTLQAVVIGSGE